MNLAELERKLIAAGRANPPGDRVPYGFAKRLMQLLRTQPVLDNRALWASALWRAAMCCVAIMLLLSALSFVSSAGSTSPNDLSQDYEQTMLASVDQDPDSLSPR